MRVTVNGTRLWFDIAGPELVPDGGTMRSLPTVLLLHGGPGGYDHSYLKPYFAGLGGLARFVFLDLRNHGRSAREDAASWSFAQCADDVRAFCDHLDIVDPIVFGHSMGGIVAMLYGAAHPEHPRALILQSTMARLDLDRLTDGFRAMGGDVVAELARRDYAGDDVSAEEWERVYAAFGPRVPDAETKSRIIRNPAVGRPGMQRLRALDIVALLPTVACPTLVSTGALDPVTSLAAAQEIVDALSPGLGRLVVLPGAGHFPWLDDPVAYERMLGEFLTGLA